MQKNTLPKLRAFFTNDNPRKVWSLTEAAPQWLRDAVYAAHCDGKDLPNDWIYEEARAACAAIEDGDFGDDIEALGSDRLNYRRAVDEYVDGRVDIYTKALYQWQADMCQTDTYAYAEERLADTGSEGLRGEKRVAALQYNAIDYIANTMIQAVVDAADEGEDDE